MFIRILKNQSLYLYLVSWAVVIAVHFFVLFSFYHLDFLPSLSDSLTFNVLYCLLGIGFWFIVDFTGFTSRSPRDIIIQYLTLGVVSIFIWITAGMALLKLLNQGNADYLMFLDSSQAMRIFTGILYYLCLISSFYLLFSNQQLQEKKQREILLMTQLREAELSMLRSQIRPHFLFNSLNSISSLTLTQSEKAHEMIIKLSDFMRYSLTFQGETMSTLEKELYHIRLYLDIEKIRFGEKLDVIYDICEDCHDWPLPAMILQPLIENAVKYGVYEATEVAGIEVIASRESVNFMKVRITNPFDADLPPRKGTGTGLKNVETRLETVYKEKGLLVTGIGDQKYITQIIFPFMDKIKALIIDDEALARQIIVRFLEDQNDIEIVGECENGFEAIKAIAEKNPDLLFLDIQMPKISGFELLEVIEPKPQIIFTTAYDQYAIRAFEMNAVDYLLKPFPKDRFVVALEKVRQKLNEKIPAKNENINRLQAQFGDESIRIDRVICRLGSKIHVIPVNQIYYIESQDDYVMVYADAGHYLKEKTMKYFESHLPGQDFIRIHRSYIVNLSQITSIDLYGKDTHLAILKCGARLKVSAEGYKRLREKIG